MVHEERLASATCSSVILQPQPQQSTVGCHLNLQHTPVLQLNAAAGMLPCPPGNYLGVQHECEHQLSGGAAVGLAFPGPRHLAFKAQRDLNRQHCGVLGAAAGAGAAQGLRLMLSQAPGGCTIPAGASSICEQGRVRVLASYQEARSNSHARSGTGESGTGRAAHHMFPGQVVVQCRAPKLLSAMLHVTSHHAAGPILGLVLDNRAAHGKAQLSPLHVAMERCPLSLCQHTAARNYSAFSDLSSAPLTFLLLQVQR